jgi:cyclopropane-fatty-acyl-phospholipid synthase
MDKILAGAITHGQLGVIWPDGSRSDYGNGNGTKALVQIRDTKTLWHLICNPGLAVGEAYMEGALVPIESGLFEMLEVLLDNVARNWRNVPVLVWNARLNRIKKPLAQANNALKSRRNVAHHYDLNGKLYALFLDRDRQYSCAYFPRGDETLEDAQIAKKRHIAAKLKLDRPGLTVLDIGCGWGGMAITLAQDYGARVTGITLSQEQLAEARRRAEAAGLSERVTFELMDYRHMQQTFDRVVSVGMFEHVGVPNFATYFAAIKRCLKPDGVALVHSIGRFEGKGSTNPWIAKYIFPGGYSPALSEVMGPVEESGLRTADIEILRLHYAKTLAHWRKRFAANRDTIASLYDERFCRMFEFYLAGSELAFRKQDHMNFQIQLVHHNQALPLARDYMVEAEREISYSQAAE